MSGLDWKTIKPHVSLERAAIARLGGPAKRSGGRLVYHCPFPEHEDRNPSFAVSEKGWRCYSCGERGSDAPALLMRLDGLTFPQAVQWLAESVGMGPSPGKSRAKLCNVQCASSRPSMGLAHLHIPHIAHVSQSADEKPAGEGPPGAAPARASGLDRPEAERIARDAVAALWRPSGAKALRYLTDERGLTLETIKRARLGFVAGLSMTTRDGREWGTGPGVVAAWREGDRLVKLAVRRLKAETKVRYVSVFEDGPSLYPSLASIRPDVPLVAVEGELEALILGQALGRFASAVTCGGSGAKVDGAVKRRALGAPKVFAAHDADAAGEKAAGRWPGAERVAPPIRPPEGKDWGDCRAAGIDLQSWWARHLPALEGALERAGICEFDAGMTRADADRSAGLAEALDDGEFSESEQP